MRKTYRDQIECLEAIGTFLARNVPSDWESIETRCEFKGGLTITRSSFQPAEAGASSEHFGIENANESVELHDCFRQLSRLVGDKKTGPFKACRYVLEKSGRYHADYEY